MVSRMKTTVELPDALLDEARRLARDRGVTLKDLLEEGLRAELARRREVRDRPREFRFRTAGRPGARVPDRPPHAYAYAHDPEP